MFENFNFELLLMTKIFYDHTGIRYNVSLYDYEDGSNYELFEDMQHCIFDSLDQDYDDCCTTILQISDPVITDFIDLCKQYNSIKYQGFPKNPFVKDLQKKLSSFDYIGSMEIVNGNPKIQLLIDEEDTIEYITMLENLFCLKEFIVEKSKELRAVLNSTVGQSAAEYAERRAA